MGNEDDTAAEMDEAVTVAEVDGEAADDDPTVAAADRAEEPVDMDVADEAGVAGVEDGAADEADEDDEVDAVEGCN